MGLDRIFLSFLITLSSTTHGSNVQEAYWTSKLPNTPMPSAILDNLKKGDISPSEDIGMYMRRTYFGKEVKHEEPLKELSLYFLEKNLKVGSEFTLRLIEKTNPAVFLPRELLNSFPLSSSSIEDIMHRFSVKNCSMEANEIVNTIKQCEVPIFFKDEKRQCISSVESMVDFAITYIGKSITAISAMGAHDKGLHSTKEKYIVENIERLDGNISAACHKLNYPYALYQCHTFSPVESFVLKVHLKDCEGNGIQTLAVCHQYDPYYMFWPTPRLAKIIIKMLNLRPKIDRLCHFLAGDALVWKPTS